MFLNFLNFLYFIEFRSCLFGYREAGNIFSGGLPMHLWHSPRHICLAFAFLYVKFPCMFYDSLYFLLQVLTKTKENLGKTQQEEGKPKKKQWILMIFNVVLMYF